MRSILSSLLIVLSLLVGCANVSPTNPSVWQEPSGVIAVSATQYEQYAVRLSTISRDPFSGEVRPVRSVQGRGAGAHGQYQCTARLLAGDDR